MKNILRGQEAQRGFCLFLYALIAIRTVVLAVGAFLPLTLPETWRQTDTLGVALRYWLRFTVEENPASRWLPAVLNSGDTSGVMPMEFPILNLLTAPAFAAGPYYGRAIAILIHLGICLGLTLGNARIWRNISVVGVPARLAMLLLPLLSFSGNYYGRFMPDYASMMLVLMAVGLSWNRPRLILSFLLAATGLAMKPTAVVVFALLLLNENFWRQLVKQAVWIGAAVLVAGIYYSAGTAYIDRFRESTNLFALGWRPFLPSLAEFLLDGRGMGRLLFYRAFFAGGSILVALVWAWQWWKGERRGWPWLTAIFLLQLLFIGGLSGLHAYGHDYYFVGLAPVCALGFVAVFRKVRSRAIWGLAIALALVPFFEANIASLKTLYRDPKAAPNLGPQCEALRKAHPEIPWGKGLPFRSAVEDYPVLGLCFGERVGSAKAAWGFYHSYSPLPEGCATLEASENLRLAACRGPAP